jgi:hypothetical protein
MPTPCMSLLAADKHPATPLLRSQQPILLRAEGSRGAAHNLISVHYIEQMRSLRSRLWILWGLTLAASLAVGLLLFQLYRASTVAQVGQAEAVVQRACDLIRGQYSFYVAGWLGANTSLTDTLAPVRKPTSRPPKAAALKRSMRKRRTPNNPCCGSPTWARRPSSWLHVLFRVPMRV